MGDSDLVHFGSVVLLRRVVVVVVLLVLLLVLQVGLLLVLTARLVGDGGRLI